MAGTSSKPEDGKKKARIEIIPLIDVIFFLLATFVLFTLSLDKIATIPVQLPKAVDTPINQKPDETMLSIQVSDAGYYFKIGTLGQAELLAENELTPRIEQYKVQFNPPRVLVRGDNRAKFGKAVLVLDKVREAGIQQVSVETVPSTSGK